MLCKRDFPVDLTKRIEPVWDMGFSFKTDLISDLSNLFDKYVLITVGFLLAEGNFVWRHYSVAETAMSRFFRERACKSGGVMGTRYN